MKSHPRFNPAQRLLHWLMAVMILAMLFIGAAMVSTLAPAYITLIDVHRPLGIAILVLAFVRLALRLRFGSPALPSDLPPWQARAAGASQVLLYLLMIVMPLVGWGMMSAGGYPVVLFGALHLPPILPHDSLLQALLRAAHRWLAYLFLLTVLVHVGAALLHALVRRDGVFSTMAPWPLSRRRAGG